LNLGQPLIVALLRLVVRGGAGVRAPVLPRPSRATAIIGDFWRTRAGKPFFQAAPRGDKNSAPRGILKIVHYFGADGVGDPAPNRCAVVIVLGSKFMGARGAFLEGLIAVPLEHQVGGAPDVDLWYHTGQLALSRSRIL
ncbi:MAG TPA: hypothetical protein VFL62_08760, partial [Bradyrhizobium sp.]|uniref:hypothetical protein n=1 Tax=Bradyrhizobium sp. TaxID=376 RepID=UPI002D80D6CC